MGQCLDKSQSEADSGDEHIIDGDVAANTHYEYQRQITSTSQAPTTSSARRRSSEEERAPSSSSSSSSSRRHHHHHHNHNHHHFSHNHRASTHSSHRHRSSAGRRSSNSSSNSRQIPNTSTVGSSLMSTHTNNNGFYSSPNGPTSILDSLSKTPNTGSGSGSGGGSGSNVYYLTPNVQRTADQLTEEDQIKLLKRMALIQQLPSGSYDENKKNKECVICMIDFEVGDTIKYLPCMHTFHASCIDDWLVRSLICPSCMEPVDAGLLAAYE